MNILVIFHTLGYTLTFQGLFINICDLHFLAYNINLDTNKLGYQHCRKYVHKTVFKGAINDPLLCLGRYYDFSEIMP